MTVAQKLQTVAENTPRVFEAGKKAQYDAFWAGYQPLDEYGNGNYYDCSFLFAGYGWTDENFNPSIIPERINRAYMMFAKNHITDLRMLPPLSVYSSQYMFYQNKSTRHVGQIVSTSPTDSLYGVFAESMVETVEKLTVSQTNKFSDTFIKATELREIRFGGTIGSAISFADCAKLSQASVQDVIDHLADLTGKDAQTLTFHPDISLTAEQKATLTAKNWTTDN